MPETKMTIDERLEKLRRQCEELAEFCHQVLREIPTGTDPANEPERFPVEHAIKPKTDHPEMGLPELLKSIAAREERRAKNRRR